MEDISRNYLKESEISVRRKRYVIEKFWRFMPLAMKFICYSWSNEIECPNVNLNGKFKQSLQRGNSGIVTVLFVSVTLFIASSIVIYSIFYLSVTARVQ